MQNLQMFGSTFSIDDDVLVKEILQCPVGELLPAGSSGKYFNDKVEYEGHFELLKNGDDFLIVYCDNELSIGDLDFHTIKITPDKDRMVFHLISKNNSDNLTMIFKDSSQLNLQALKRFKETKTFHVVLLAMVFGGFAMEKSFVIHIPQEELDKIPL